MKELEQSVNIICDILNASMYYKDGVVPTYREVYCIVTEDDDFYRIELTQTEKNENRLQRNFPQHFDPNTNSVTYYLVDKRTGELINKTPYKTRSGFKYNLLDPKSRLKCYQDFFQFRCSIFDKDRLVLNHIFLNKNILDRFERKYKLMYLQEVSSS